MGKANTIEKEIIRASKISKSLKGRPGRKGKDSNLWRGGKNETIECKQCENIFENFISNKRKYCSRECKSKSQIGRKLSIQIRKKMSDSHKTEENIKLVREQRKNQIFPKKDTSIEVKIQNFLKILKIEFYTHYWMNIKHNYQCDILIPSKNIVIECDGDYWHGNPNIFKDNKLTERILKQREIDKNRTTELNKKGFKVLRLWENEIKVMNINKFEDRIKWLQT